MAESKQQNFPINQKTKNWLYVVFLIFAAYLIYDSLVYFLSPFSGRISTMVCKMGAEEKTVCTVTIYGIRDIYQRTFLAEDFEEAIVIKHFRGDSYDTTYGITILTSKEQINFVHATQPSRKISEMALKISIVPSTLYIGFNSSFYRRVILLILGFVIVLRVYKSGRSILVFDKPVIGHSAFWPFALHWVKNIFLVRLFFYLSIAFILGIWDPFYPTIQADFINSCGHVFRYNYRFSEFPLNYSLCLYPLLAILVLQAMVQWQLLKNVKVNISIWWTIVPIGASLLLMVLSPNLACVDCHMLKYLMSGIPSSFDANIRSRLVVYFLIVGFFQWLFLRRNLSLSIGWAIMPLINAMLVVAVFVILDFLEISEVYYLVFLPTIILSDIIPALYISWLINIKNHVQTEI